MNTRKLAMAFVGVCVLALLASASRGEEPVKVEIKTDGGADVVAGAVVNRFTMGWPTGGGGMVFGQFMMTLTQLNMTPEFTLDKDQKQEIQDINDEWKAAQAAFMKEHKDEFDELSQEQMEAFKSRDQAEIQAAMQKMQDLYATGPDAEVFVTKAKAVLTADQRKVIEDSLAKTEADRKAMMEHWKQAQEGRK